MIQQLDPNVSSATFHSYIQDFQKRKILQGENTLYITPTIFHIWLWKEYWETFGVSFVFEEFVSVLNPALRKWFFEMFKYARESGVASQVVKKLLGPEGPFKDAKSIEATARGDFFLALTEADPKSAVISLQKTFGTLPKDELLKFETGRREVIWSLERIAIHRDLFIPAAQLLLCLAEAENESYSNNASGVFASLFSPAPSPVAPTQASPEERFPILAEALHSTSKERRLLAIKGCTEALQTQHFTRMVGPEYQGLHEVTDLWKPKTYGELFDAYRRVWNLLLDSMPKLDSEEQLIASSTLIRSSRGLAQMESLTTMLVDGLRNLATNKFVDPKNVLKEVVEIIHYDGPGMDSISRKLWESFRDELTGTDFSSLLKRFVALQLLEDQYDESGKRTDVSLHKLQQLASVSVSDPVSFEKELDWLVTTEAENGYAFGYELGTIDKTFSLLEKILRHQKAATKDPSVYFSGGYFKALFEIDPAKWDSELEALVEDEITSAWIPELTFRSGMTDAAAIRILKLAKFKKIGVLDFRQFTYGSVTNHLSPEVLEQWIDFLLMDQNDTGVSIAIDLYDSYYLRADRKLPLPEDKTLLILTHHSLVEQAHRQGRSQMIEFHWTQIGKIFIELYPTRCLELSQFMLVSCNINNLNKS